jgi:Fe-S-cluster containining protein
MTAYRVDKNSLDTIFHECRQCGTCCKKYRRILLHPDEIDFIKKMGGYVGVDLHINDLRGKTLAEASKEAQAAGKVYMIHPDDKGCVFLQKNNGKYSCKIYHYRPRVCRGFKCNLVDQSFLQLINDDAITLLGQNQFGLPL